MLKQKDLIEGEDWDCLVILDACRYDYFEKVYGDYLDGDLQKVRSIASDTPDWLTGTFKDENYNNVVYVSANPFINSKDVEFVEGFNGSEIFYKVFDAWDWKFNLNYMTVLPENMGKATRLAKAKYPDKRIITHFMQPHWPYVTREPFQEAFPGPLTQAWEEEKNKGPLDRVGDFFEKLGETILGELRMRRIKDSLNLRRPDPEELMAQKYGNDFLHEAYEENLRSALGEVVKITERIPGQVMVTSDHGEFLGEDGIYSHHSWSDSPILREVPWLEVRV